MSTIILDYSANTHKNDLYKISSAIDAISIIDTKKHNIVFKSQLFVSAGKNVVCTNESFNFMYNRCKEMGYQCTSSVFDEDSLNYLLSYTDLPFIKIANNRNLDYLIGKIPREIPVYCSFDSTKMHSSLSKIELFNELDQKLHCVSEYPANIENYRVLPGENISDHTVGLDLYKRFSPRIWEKHLMMIGDDGLDSGPFSVTPEELKEIL